VNIHHLGIGSSGHLNSEVNVYEKRIFPWGGKTRSELSSPTKQFFHRGQGLTPRLAGRKSERRGTLPSGGKPGHSSLMDRQSQHEGLDLRGGRMQNATVVGSIHFVSSSGNREKDKAGVRVVGAS